MKKLSILGLMLIINNIFLMASEQVSLVGKVTDEDNRPVSPTCTSSVVNPCFIRGDIF